MSPGSPGTAADQVHGAGDHPGRPATPPREPGRRRRMPAREIHDQIHQARQRADRVIDHDAAASGAAGDRQLAWLQAERGRDIVGRVAATADEERDHQHRPRRRERQRLGQLRVVVEETDDHRARDAAPAQRFGQLKRGVAAGRAPPGAVAGQQQRRLRPGQTGLPQQLAHPARHQRRDAGMRPDGRRLPQAHGGVALVAAERLGQDLIGVVA